MQLLQFMDLMGENSFDPVVELINFDQVSWYLPHAPYLSKWKKRGNSWFSNMRLDGNTKNLRRNAKFNK